MRAAAFERRLLARSDDVLRHRDMKRAQQHLGFEFGHHGAAFCDKPFAQAIGNGKVHRRQWRENGMRRRSLKQQGLVAADSG